MSRETRRTLASLCLLVMVGLATVTTVWSGILTGLAIATFTILVVRE